MKLQIKKKRASTNRNRKTRRWKCCDSEKNFQTCLQTFWVQVWNRKRGSLKRKQISNVTKRGENCCHRAQTVLSNTPTSPPPPALGVACPCLCWETETADFLFFLFFSLHILNHQNKIKRKCSIIIVTWSACCRLDQSNLGWQSADCKPRLCRQPGIASGCYVHFQACPG